MSPVRTTDTSAELAVTSIELIEDRVHYGAKWLDRNAPTIEGARWFDVVDVENLDMGNGIFRGPGDCGCVGAQLDFHQNYQPGLNGVWRNAVGWLVGMPTGFEGDGPMDRRAFDTLVRVSDALGLTITQTEEREYGFRDAYRQLTELWRDEIIDRRTGAYDWRESLKN